MLVNCCLIHDKCCIDYPDRRGENGKLMSDIGGHYGGEKEGETQINCVLAPCLTHLIIYLIPLDGVDRNTGGESGHLLNMSLLALGSF